MSAPLDALAAIPLDADGPVFREPWEAQAFALAVRLHERGLFTWSEWAAALARRIAAAREAGDPDRGDGYWRHWLAALEALLAEKGCVAPAELAARADAIAHETARDHRH